MKSMTTTKRKIEETVSSGADAIAQYDKAQNAEHAAICRALRAEIDAVLPKATSKIWHGSPVWFIGENPVVGYNVTAKKGVNLLFWNGQSFGEPALKALRRWLKSASTDIWDGRSYFLSQKALQKKAKQ